MKMRQLEMRAHVHANRGSPLRHQMPLYQDMARHGIWHTSMQILVAKYDAKRPQNMETWHPIHGMRPEMLN